ncbi:MAG: FliI/YscN family ATPase [Deltaproteobacteria bacterium]|nr:FliI/YscN family ATPase [Deltaproteobacteria bacterium]
MEATSFQQLFGTVSRVRRDAVRTFLPDVKVGAVCHIETERGKVPVEIVSLDPTGHTAMPLDDLDSVRLGDRVVLYEQSATVAVGPGLLGQVIDSMGISYETHKPMALPERVPLLGAPLNPMEREIIRDSIDLGVRSVNACLACGKGQRQGIFAGSGVGKSVLLGMMARFTSADVVVIGLIGERGREVKEFLERELGDKGRERAVVVVETAERSPVRRTRGAHVAVAVSEYFRYRGANVLLLMDSLTRFAMAQREIGMAAGEPPTSKGYTPSVFSGLSRLVERAGNWGPKGSITGLYTVLVEGDDLEDPIADASRAILDGHIVLSRQLANRGHYPAVDVLVSVSRVMDQLVSPEHRKMARLLKQRLAKYTENEESISFGMYPRGTDPVIDEAIESEPGIRKFLQQDSTEHVTLENSAEDLINLFAAEIPR